MRININGYHALGRLINMTCSAPIHLQISDAFLDDLNVLWKKSTMFNGNNDNNIIITPVLIPVALYFVIVYLNQIDHISFLSVPISEQFSMK